MRTAGVDGGPGGKAVGPLLTEAREEFGVFGDRLLCLGAAQERRGDLIAAPKDLNTMRCDAVRFDWIG